MRSFDPLVDADPSIEYTGLGVYCLRTQQWVARPRDEVFAFLSNNQNLDQLTAPLLEFKPVNPTPLAMCEGTGAEYRVKLHGITMRWVSRIDLWEPPDRFSDVQVEGPYRYWRHEHRFEERDGGTVIIDEIHYTLPGAVFGRAIHWLLVKRDLRRIFRLRARRHMELFSSPLPPGEG